MTEMPPSMIPDVLDVQHIVTPVLMNKCQLFVFC